MGYKTDLTNKQWNIIARIFASKKGQHLAEHIGNNNMIHVSFEVR